MIAIIYLVKATVIVLTAAAVVALAADGRHPELVISSAARDRWLAHAAARVVGGPGWTTISLVPNRSEDQPILDTETEPTIRPARQPSCAGDESPNLAAGTTDSSHLTRDRTSPDATWAAMLLSAVYLWAACTCSLSAWLGTI